MSKTYAIADLHGRFDLLEIALARLAERVEPAFGNIGHVGRLY